MTTAQQEHPLVAQFGRMLDQRERRTRERLTNAALLAGILACWGLITALGGVPGWWPV